MNIPEWVADVFYSYLTTELIYFDGKYAVATPVATFFDAERNSIFFSTSVAFYTKVKCIKKHPTISLLYWRGEYSGLSDDAVVLVQGRADISEDFEKNNAFLSDLIQKQKDTWKKEVYIKMGKELDTFMGRLLMDWYTLRMLIEVIPENILAWKNGEVALESANPIGPIYSGGEAVLAFMGETYPIGFPVKYKRINGTNGKFLIEKPKAIKVGDNACLLIHSHNEYVKNISLSRFKGKAIDLGEKLEFTPVAEFSFRQGGILNSLRFILDGKRRAKKFLKEYRRSFYRVS